jgi:hypothetical protein
VDELKVDRVEDAEYVDSVSERVEMVRWRAEPYSVSFRVSRDSFDDLRLVGSLVEEVEPERCFRSLEIPELDTS